MSFDYNKNKGHGGQDSFWTSYSDLFLGLSTIFLLLYVTTSLRTGTDAIRNQVENQKLTMQVEELKNQLKMYEQVKNEYMQKEASKDESQEYQELMDKLTLLQDDAKTEKEKLTQQALENDKKEKALNKYQQMVRNIMNANKVAKTKLIHRDDLIKDQDVEIQDKQTEITGLQQDVQQKKQLIAQGEEKIQQSELALQQRMKQLRDAYKTNKITKQRFEARAAQIQAESQKSIAALSDANAKYSAQLQQTSDRLNKTTGELQQAQASIGQKEGEIKGLYGKLQAASAEGQAKIASLEAGFAAQKAKDRAEFEAGLNKLKLGAAERERREGQYRAAAAQKEKDLNGKLAGLRGQLNDTEGQLAKAKAEIDARKSVAGDIKNAFAQAGVKADIDMESGDVVLDFGQTYFDSDSDHLKSEMKKVLEKAMPAYSKSLFSNQKIAEKISSVEIIGFASPTYQGRFIDPKSSKPEDKQAIKYNMDLSYRRANAIFGYVLDDQNVKFEHQKQLVGMMKVSGRSFLENMKMDRNVASMEDFCKVNDCKKAQRVIVRFSMDKK